MTSRPNIHQSFRSRLVVAVFIGLASVVIDGSPQVSAQDSLPPVTARPVRIGQSNSSYQLLGTVTPSRTTTIGYALAGRLRTLHATRGDRLAAGDAVADLQTDVVEIEIAAAKAELRLVQQQLAELEAGSRAEDIAEAKA